MVLDRTRIVVTPNRSNPEDHHMLWKLTFPHIQVLLNTGRKVGFPLIRCTRDHWSGSMTSLEVWLSLPSPSAILLDGSAI